MFGRFADTTAASTGLFSESHHSDIVQWARHHIEVASGRDNLAATSALATIREDTRLNETKRDAVREGRGIPVLVRLTQSGY